MDSSVLLINWLSSEKVVWRFGNQEILRILENF
jgi:hypothetical protein